MDEEVKLEIQDDKISINIAGMEKLAFVDYTSEMYELIKNARFSIPKTEKAIENYKYPYSNEYKKSYTKFHLIIIWVKSTGKKHTGKII